MKLKLITEPAAEPLTTAQIKTHLRVTSSDDDTYIGLILTAARRQCEEYTRRAFISQTWEIALDAAPAEDYVELWRAPLASITSVKSYDEDDTASTMSTSDYNADTYAEPGRVVLAVGASWPTTSLRSTNGIIIRYVAGYGAAGSSVPEALLHAIKETARALYDSDTEAWDRAKKLMQPFRVMRL